MAQARSLLPASQALLTLHRYPAGAPLPGQGAGETVHCLTGITLSSESSQSAGTGTAVQGRGHGRDSSDTVQQGWHCDKDGRDRCTAEPGATGCAWLAPGVSRASLWHCFPSGSTKSQPVCFTLNTKKEDKMRPAGPKHWDCLATQNSCSLQPLCDALSSQCTSHAMSQCWSQPSQCAGMAAPGAAAGISCSSRFSLQ